MNKLKKIISIMVVMILIFVNITPVVYASEIEDESLNEEIYIDMSEYRNKPFYEEGYGLMAMTNSTVGASMVAEGAMTLGGIIMMLLGVVAAEHQLNIEVDRLKNMSLEEASQYIYGPTVVPENHWLYDASVYVGDGVTKIADVIDLGTEYSIWDFIIPIEQVESISVNSNVRQYIYEFLLSRYDGNLAVGTYDSDIIAITGALEDINIGISSENLALISEYEYIILGAEILSGQLYVDIRCSNTPFTTEYYKVNTGTYRVRTVPMNAHLFQNYSSNIVTDRGTNTMANMYLSNVLKTSVPPIELRQAFANVLYTTHDLTFNDLVLKGMRETFVIEDTSHQVISDGEKANAITINPYLVQEMSKISTLDGVKTDTVVKALSDADVKARIDGQTVVQNPIIATDIPDNPDLGIFQGLLDAIKEAMRWLFVPDKSKVEAFVAQATATVEGNSGLLSYPIELVIRFLNEVNDLGQQDCILVIPPIQFKGHILYGGSSFNFTQYVKKPEFSDIYAKYKMITNFIMIIAVISLAIKKGDEIIRGN